ncbi:hypothetical protein [Microbacterium candidum]|uniref:XRE family transcriptional regulator n=1 Tax=Microbacterium candidum TaxID=3041922 RepID=A0ABT7MW11_9MICO|nr:hypothetical protein [Microbacterium sp. ASV49]MDL9978639.1 hypothetical protein [Microbacterium sp. ASV49]
MSHEIAPPWPADLTFIVECRSSAGRSSEVRHPVTIHREWSVSTPHDLDAERVAVAFGGYTSCLGLVDETIPALRPVMPLLARTVRPAIRQDKRGQFRPAVRDLIAGCCRGRAFPSIGSVCEHLRDPVHVCAALGVASTWQVPDVLRAVGAACAPTEEALSRAVLRVREPTGVMQLWRAGIHPADIPALAEPAGSIPCPLPVSYYLGVAYNNVDTIWLNEVLVRHPDADAAAWLAWLPAALQVDSEEWGSWLSFGLRRDNVATAVQERIPASTVGPVAETAGWSRGHAARMIVDWARTGCYPTPSDFAALVRLGLDFSVPSKKVLDSLSTTMNTQPYSLDPRQRTDLGLLLVALGTRSAVIGALGDGVRALADLDRSRATLRTRRSR